MEDPEVTDAEIVVWVETDRHLTAEELARAQAAAQVALNGRTDVRARPVVFVNYYPRDQS